MSGIGAWIQELEGLAAMSRQDLESLQLERCHDLLKRLHERQGFYRDLPQRLQSLADLAHLPFTDPQDLADHPGAFLLLSQKDIARVTTDQSSGTTGPPKRLYYSAQDRARTRSFFAAGIGQFAGPGHVVGIFMPFSGAESLGDLIAGAVEDLGAKPVPMALDEAYGPSLERLVKEGVTDLIIMPIPFLSLLRAAKALGWSWQAKNALLSADTVSPATLTAIRAMTPAKLWTHYGSRECGLGGAVSCAYGQGMHIRENDLLMEVVDQEGRPVRDGIWGDLVFTSLYAQAMPFVRYRTGDRVMIYPDPCPCGSPVKRLAVAGRFGHEKMSLLDDAFFALPGLIDYHVKKEGDAWFFRFLSDGSLDRETLRSLLRSQGVAGSLEIGLSTVSSDDSPFYRGKRKIMEV